MPSLSAVLEICAAAGLSLLDGDVRVLAWCKTFGAFKRNVRVAYVWEPVILRPPRRLPGAAPTRDFAFDEPDGVLAEPITMKRGLSGAKPERFSYWLFNCLGLRPQDRLDDLYPGTGAVSDAWAKWVAEGGPKLKQSISVSNEMVMPPPTDKEGVPFR